MTTIERLTRNIEANNDLMNRINKMNYYSVDSFIRDAQRYIKAIKEGRMINSIGHVSASGMSRSIKFVSIEKNNYTKGYSMQNYFQFFKALGYNESRGREHYFTIGGCGMDMIFHTNYTNIHRLHRLGFITKNACDSLAQATPSTI